MPYTFGSNPGSVSAAELVFSNFEDFQNEFKKVKYGQLQWREVVPEGSINGAINPGATEVSYGVEDWRGKGDWRSPLDDNVPTVTWSVNKVLVPIQVAGVEAKFDREDARQVAMGYDVSLMSRLPSIMRMACERHVEGTVFYGDQNVNFRGFLGYTGIPVTSALNSGRLNGATASQPASRQWANKTADQIVFDINNAITTVWNTSRFVHLPDTLYMPGDAFGALASRTRTTAGDGSLLAWVKMNNTYTARTGMALKIIPIRYLSGAGAGGVDRMVVADMSDPDNTMMPFPIPFEMLEPQPWKYAVHIPAEYKFGSYHVPYPRSRLYVDGI